MIDRVSHQRLRLLMRDLEKKIERLSEDVPAPALLDQLERDISRVLAAPMRRLG